MFLGAPPDHRRRARVPRRGAAAATAPGGPSRGGTRVAALADFSAQLGAALDDASRFLHDDDPRRLTSPVTLMFASFEFLQND